MELIQKLVHNFALQLLPPGMGHPRVGHGGKEAV